MTISRLFGLCLVLCAFASVSDLRAQAPYQFSTVTGTGRRAPAPSKIGLANSPTINASGRIAYEADGGVFLETRGKTKLVAAIGVDAPWGGQFLSAGSPSMNAAGHLAFVGAAQAPSGSGIFLFESGKSRLVAAEGQNTSVGPIFGLNSPSLSANDEVAFLSFNGVFTEANGVVNKVVLSGDPSPEGDIFSSFSFPQINSSGQLVFTASLASGTTGIYLATSGAIQKIVNSNDSSPFGGSFAFFFDSASINDSGQIAFSGIVNGPAASSGIYIYSAGQLAIKVPEFTQFGNGLQLVSTQSPSINASGDVAFSGQLLNAFDSGIYMTSGNNLIQVMTPGQTAPDGGVFTSGFAPVLNDVGQVVLDAREQAVNNTVVLFSNSQLTRVAGPGDPVDQPARFTFPFTSGGINDVGTVLFQDVTFPGGDGLFTGSSSKGGASVKPVAVENEVLPDGGSLFEFFENVAINDKNQVVFDTRGFADSNDLILESGGKLTTIARGSISNGGPAPDGGTFFNFGSASINNLAQVAFAGSTIGGAGQGLYLYSQGEVTVLIDDFTPGPSGASLGTFSSPSLNDNGDVAFFDQPFPQPNAILFLSGGNLTVIAKDGGPAPGGGNVSLPFPDPSFGPSVNVQGQVVFSADLSTGGEAVYLYSQGALVRIAGPGDATPDGTVFTSASSATINAAGEIVFSGTTNTGDAGVYTYTHGTIVTVAHSGTPIGSGMTLVAAFLPSLNRLGQISFTGALGNGASVVLVASPSNTRSTTSGVVSSSGLSAASPVTVSPEQARARIDRALHRGVFAEASTKSPGNRERPSNQVNTPKN
jgi:hypothetical protein